MIKKFIDTNIFVEVFVRKGVKSERSYKLLEEEFGLYTNLLVISEMEWVMRAGYKIAKSDIIRCMKKIFSSDIGIENKKLLINVLDYFEINNVDWTDCLNMFLLKQEKIDEVYSYDKGLDKYKWVKRLEP